MSIKEMINRGIWLVTLDDNTKWVVDVDNKLMDSYKWYKAVGTLETECNEEDIQKMLFSDSKKIRRIKNERNKNKNIIKGGERKC